MGAPNQPVSWSLCGSHGLSSPLGSPAHSSLLRPTCSLVPPATSLPQARAAAEKDALLVMTFRDPGAHTEGSCNSAKLRLSSAWGIPCHLYPCHHPAPYSTGVPPSGSKKSQRCSGFLGGVYSRAGPSRGEQGRGWRLGGDSRGCCEELAGGKQKPLGSYRKAC